EWQAEAGIAGLAEAEKEQAITQLIAAVIPGKKRSPKEKPAEPKENRGGGGGCGINAGNPLLFKPDRSMANDKKLRFEIGSVYKTD
ncbi:MAG: hypothetical protein LBL76_03140, partial [Treponema sp.]|nr:hypothetical protein [Treponema sp.]